MMKLHERLKDWYGMPEFMPSATDEEILPIIEGIEKMEKEHEVMSVLLVEIYDMIELRIPKHDALLTAEEQEDEPVI